jgi:hypothetical protein
MSHGEERIAPPLPDSTKLARALQVVENDRYITIVE